MIKKKLISLTMAIIITVSLLTFNKMEVKAEDSSTDIVEIAYSQLDNGKNKQYPRPNKYTEWFGSNDAWCVMFISWCADKADIPKSIIPKVAATSSTKSSLKSFFDIRGEYVEYDSETIKKIKPGDIIFTYGLPASPAHVGIVWKIEGETIYSIEGNMANNDGTKNYVKIAKRNFSNDHTLNTTNKGYGPIRGYARPSYGGEHEHEYNELGLCKICKDAFPLNIVAVSKKMKTTKARVPGHSVPYDKAEIVGEYETIGTDISIKSKTINSHGELWYQTIYGGWIVSDYLEDVLERTKVVSLDASNITSTSIQANVQLNNPLEYEINSLWVTVFEGNSAVATYSIKLIETKSKQLSSSTTIYGLKPNTKYSYNCVATINNEVFYSDNTVDFTTLRADEPEYWLEYRYRVKEKITSTESSMPGWELLNSTTKFGEWSEVQTTTTKPQESETLKITGSNTIYKWYHYCNYYDGGWNIDSISYGSKSVYHSCTTSGNMNKFNMADKGNQQPYGGKGSANSHSCSYNFYVWWPENPSSVTTYTYQTRKKSLLYEYSRWSDWSKWSEERVEPTSECEVETRKMYR